MAKGESAYRYWHRLMRGINGKDRSKSQKSRKKQRGKRK